MVWNKGRTMSQETRKNMSATHRKAFENGRMPWNKGKHLSEEHKRKIGNANRGIFERSSKGLIMYYKTHTVWNKGSSWPSEVRERIRKGCLNSEIGMGPKGPWKYVKEERQHQEEVIV